MSFSFSFASEDPPIVKEAPPPQPNHTPLLEDGRPPAKRAVPEHSDEGKPRVLSPVPDSAGLTNDQKDFIQTWKFGTHFVHGLSSVAASYQAEQEGSGSQAGGNTAAGGSAVKQALRANCDVVPGQYEGGLTLWECSLDLCHFVANVDDIDWASSAVLELGCGAGLPGLLALSLGAQVTFQDYNMETLTTWTRPNALANGGISAARRCTFAAGDWAQLEPDDLCTPDGRQTFDVILMAETVYRTESIPALVKLMRHCLARPSQDSKSGVALVAAKSYYFGVGGGTAAFATEVMKAGDMMAKREWTSGTGVQREILKVTWKPAIESSGQS